MFPVDDSREEDNTTLPVQRNYKSLDCEVSDEIKAARISDCNEDKYI